MIATIERKLLRRWHHARRRSGFGVDAPMRLIVEKAPWLDDAASPVVLMIDDLTNAWHDGTAGRQWEGGGDWGGALQRPGSALRFLEDRLLREFPEARVTFFTVAGPISAYTHHQPFRHAAALDADEASRQFFAALASDPRFELAYHGYNHGTPGDCSDRFLQEWRGFESRAAAVAQTRRGLAIFQRAVGANPRGGKYGGWDYNGFADDAVDECGFLWWCRDWMPCDVAGKIGDEYYEPQWFGRNLVVALPSTVHGHFWDPQQIDVLLARRQVIAIEEHIAPVRPDGLTQTPNIVDDIDDLRRLYAYLRRQRVWHATGTQVATYVIARERSLVYDVTRDGFSIRYDGRIERPSLTLLIDASALGDTCAQSFDVVTPDGVTFTPATVSRRRGRRALRVTLPVVSGRYAVHPRAAVAVGEGG
jgi:peptidoglycan/xylan/chitin deacetylase (PgdA/CDA1 family)